MIGRDTMLLRVDKVTKSFDGFVAVQDVELTVAQGQIACIIGPNGAGKSTIFNLITGTCVLHREKFFSMTAILPAFPPTESANSAWVGRSSAPTFFRVSRLRQRPGGGAGTSQKDAQFLYPCHKARAGRDVYFAGTGGAGRRSPVYQWYALLWLSKAAPVRHCPGQ